ncbi:hypothetical protein CUR65_12280 [Salmonella enterica subsp. enterica serovar Legon]|uniref:hypothetical protein n=1 Tax=Salmonella enterica TaxID=28901 RepID=UPI000D3E9E8A|nr:hypothetical protein [Salmonella enterica]EDP8616398.1 hypothetical protein [Salmonella enterica subsp. enterica]EAU0218107.1 hypothetical protein [Salmonella enterica]EBR5151940.1 hypothetical protein [Salmonella enterica]EKY7088667.1 hypothetical protein [Salmonella enterica]MBH0432458.1 hypothetical protein [Salmonella enterica]
MNNLEKMRAAGEAVYGKNWQSPLSRALGVSDRTVRNFISGETSVPVNLSTRLIDAMETEISKIKKAIEIINSDKIRGDDVTIEMICEIAGRYQYPDEMTREYAIDAMNNAIYETTYLSDLDAIARKFSTINKNRK